MLELLGNILQLDRAAELLQEVVVVNNCSTVDYGSVRDFVNEHPTSAIRYVDAPENLGVARGRNYALRLGVAPIIIMLDDDATLQNGNALVNLLEEFETDDEDRKKAIVSFKVLYYDTLEMQQNALPHKRFGDYKDKPSFDTYYYAGGAHAVRRSVLAEVGVYPEDFFYGMEEYDMSYRVLEAGYRIVYSDRVVMLHKESPLGRKPKEEKIRMMWVNKSKVAYRYLPIWYFYSTAIMWSLFYLKETGWNWRGWRNGWREVRAIRQTEARKVISQETMRYLKNVRARIWY